ncbi:MAG: PAS domain-containing protein, partial [Candidatus Omnitrophica bacterium]|nr:PAS domain-containing protein [Candidatus Omnitrophota bacterium]
MIHEVLTVDTVATSHGFLIRLRGDLFASTVPRLAQTIDAIQRVTADRIILDLADLVHIDSRGIGALVGWHRHFTNRGIKFEITKVSESVLQPLRVCHLDSILEIGPDAVLARDKLRLQRDALWKSYDFASQILAGLGEGLIAVNLDCKIVYLNPAAETILDTVEEYLIGKPLLESIEILNLTDQEFMQSLLTDSPDLEKSQGRSQREIEIRKQDGETVWVRIIFTPIFRSESRQGTILNLIDITDEIHARRAGIRHLGHLESLKRISGALRNGIDIEHMMDAALRAVKEIFDCDRAWLLYPCDPQAEAWDIQIEVTNPEFPGAHSRGQKLPITPAIRGELIKHLNTDDPVVYDKTHPFPSTAEFVQEFQIHAQLAITIYPHLGEPWLFGIHHCATERGWTPNEISLFKEISFSISEALNSLLFSRVHQAKEESLRSVLEITGGVPETEFFENKIQYVCERLGFHHGFIGQIVGEKRVSTLAVFKNSAKEQNFEFPIEGSVSQRVIGKEYQSLTGDIASQFPNDPTLMGFEVRRLVGVPLYDPSGKILGLIVAMDHQEASVPGDAQVILGVLAERVSSVIEQKRSE